MKLRLYVAGSSARSTRAIQSVRSFTEAAEGEAHDLEVVDIRRDPARAEEDRILATPTLIRLHPTPQRRIVGDLVGNQRLQDLLSTPQDFE